MIEIEHDPCILESYYKATIFDSASIYTPRWPSVFAVKQGNSETESRADSKAQPHRFPRLATVDRSVDLQHLMYQPSTLICGIRKTN